MFCARVILRNKFQFMSMGVEESDFSGSLDINPEIPIKLSPHLCRLTSPSSFDELPRNVVHVSGGNCPCHMELVEGVARKGQSLEIRYFNPDGLLWWNIAYFQCQDILALFVQLSIGSLFTLLDGLLVLSLRLLFLFDHSFDPHIPKLG